MRFLSLLNFTLYALEINTMFRKFAYMNSVEIMLSGTFITDARIRLILNLPEMMLKPLNFDYHINDVVNLYRRGVD